ncbi:FMN reductase [Actinorhabdospora filicis]|uniref:FMN reductase n=1 Tax=Actinorhabdospora filicis TaxID=1785913 RepID=A0A9W6WCJ9_9ACTN|nr:NAD(P)H-dependent oxidoreductase [Actinorhabdospora filicis]GLZ80661.1 FMN reductase [Actinorhabdospora filicis]
MSLVIVVGNPRTASRTRVAAEQLAADLSADPPRVLDLAALGPGAIGATEATPAVSQAVQDAAGARLLLVATPVYKASFTGLLKLFLDRFPPGGLDGAVAVPVLIGAAPAHLALADLQLRIVLAELGAALPAPSLLVEERELPAIADVTASWVKRHGGRVA